MLERSTIFWWIKVFIPVMQGALFTTIIAIAIRLIFHDETILYRGIWGTTIFSSIFYFSAIDGYIDYTMDYCIITPDEVILTQQEGIFKRTVRTLDGAKVKSIYINKQSIIYSIFDSWTMVFMSDGDEQFWEIVFDYIRDPETQKDIVQSIMELNPHRHDTHNN